MNRAVLTAAGVCLAATLAFGQGRGGFGGNPPDPAQIVARRVAILTNALTLTDAQQAQATKIFTDAQEAAAKYREEMQAARTSLQDAVRKNDAAGIERYARDIGTATGDMTSVEARAQGAFYALLTPEQTAKYDKLPGRGMGAPGMMGPAGMAGRMRPPAQ